MKLVKYGPTGSDETATYDVFGYPKKVTDFIQEVLKRINEWGSIEIKGYGSIDYKYGKLSNDIPKVLNNLTISNVKASGGWSYMSYYISVEQQEKILNELDKAAIEAHKKLQDEGNLSYYSLFMAGVEYQKDKYDKLKAVSHKLYTAAQYLSDNPNSAESLRQAMTEYYNFINDKSMKAYTDLEQSQKLAKILSLDSADMHYINGSGQPVLTGWAECGHDYDDIPCWSFVVLLSLLPKHIIYTPNPGYEGYACLNIETREETFSDDNPVDCCVEMIIKNYEQNKYRLQEEQKVG